jgi:hypothetical protein
MTGYQGWFGTPGDGGTNGWRHYNNREGFRPGAATIEYWPDMREADEDERYPTPFVFDDGTPATVFSSVNPKTVNRHFQWMKEYGIDGAFVQRFRSDFGIQDVLTKVMANALAGAENNDRAIAVMYDISGTNIFANGSDEASVNALRTQIVNQIFDDWKNLVDELSLTTKGDDQAYLYHNGRPLVALWGLGFPSRHNPQGVDMDFWDELITIFQDDPDYGGCSIMLGVPTRWRTGGGDAVSGAEHDRLIEFVKRADVVMPWHTSRFARSDMSVTYRNLVQADNAWCDAEGLDYAPTVSPGIREFLLNLNNYERPREGGLYFWDMARAALAGGSNSLYFGMFDEIDEGTQYFKVHKDPPYYSETLSFTDYGNDPEDHYLWLAGEATRALRGEFTMEPTFRERADDADFQSGIDIDDSGANYSIRLSTPTSGRAVYYADPYKVPDGAPTVGTELDTSLFKNQLTASPATFTEEQRGQYLRFVEVDATTREVIAYKAMVAVHGYARPPYTTSFESPETDAQFWTYGSDDESGSVMTTAADEPNTGDRHLLFSRTDGGTTAVTYADLHLDLSGIITDVILEYAAKTLGSPTATEDGVYLSADGGETFELAHVFTDVSATYKTFAHNLNDLADSTSLAFTDQFVVRFRYTAQDQTGQGGLVLDDVSLQYSTEQGGFAQFVGSDDQTQGAWKGRYGVDGYYIAGKVDTLPEYASISWDAKSTVAIWEDASMDPRGLSYGMDSTILSARTAAADDHPWTFTIDVGDTESNVYLYFLDEVGADRSFILNVVDGATGDRYDVRTVQNFSDGLWLGWKLRGEVTFILELLNGPGAVVSGVFFAPAAPTEITVADYLTFDGMDDYVDAGRDTALQLSGTEMTVEAWFNVDSADTRTDIFQSTILAMDHSEPGNDQGYFLRASSQGQIEWGFGDGQWYEIRSEAGVQLFETGVWNHVAGTYDGTVQKIYLNGNLIATSEPFVAMIGQAPTEPLYIGASPAFEDRGFHGGIAEVRIWNVARSDSEIKEFATQRVAGSEPDLVAAWAIDEGEGQYITDESPAQRQAVLGGSDVENERDPVWTEGDIGPELVDALEGFNGSFENDFELWRFFEVPNQLGSTREIITGEVVDGAKAARITFVEADADLVDRSLDSWDSNVPLKAGADYFGSFWAKSPDFANGVLRVTFGYFDADRNVLGEGTESYVITDTYQQYNFNFTPPEGTEKGWISFRWKDEANTEFRAGVIDIDHVQLLTEKELPVSTRDPLSFSRDHTVLRPNYPNPFGESTTIEFYLPETTPVSLQVYDVNGRRVTSLLNEQRAAGEHLVTWNAYGLPGGTYFLLLRTKSTIRTRKMMLSER